MKTWLTKLTAGCALLFVFASCEKDETKAVVNVGNAATLSASATTATLTSATATNTAVTYTWSAADFGYQSATTYYLQFAKRGTNFATPYEVNVGPALSKTFTVAQLNDVFAGVDCNSAGTATALDVRVRAFVGDKVASTTSGVVGLQATPYQAQSAPAHTWAIIGSATPGGWNADTPLTYDYCSHTWTGRVALVVGEVKFRADGGWSLNYGDDGNNGSLEAGGANIPVTAAGTYNVVLNVEAATPTYSLTR